MTVDNTEDETYDILIMGSAYTPHYGDEETTLFNHNQMNNDFTKQLDNLPVFIEHDTRHQIGNVVDSFVNEKRQVKALLHIHGNREVNKLLPATLYKDPENDSRGYYNSLSLGNSVGFVRNGDKVSVQNNVPSEISVCMNGDRPMTEIDDYWFVPKGKNVRDFIRENIDPTIQRF
jgi:hypothetical protein